MKIRVFDFEIVFYVLEKMWGTLSGLSELHFGPARPPDNRLISDMEALKR